jgi:hypothetical protein
MELKDELNSKSSNLEKEMLQILQKKANASEVNNALASKADI